MNPANKINEDDKKGNIRSFAIFGMDANGSQIHLNIIMTEMGSIIELNEIEKIIITMI